MTSATSLLVEHLFSITAATAELAPVTIPRASGNLTIISVTSGSFEGSRLKGRIVPAAGGDWVSIREDGSMRLDVRLVLETEDGALVYMTYGGVGRVGADGSITLRTAPLFETGSETYQWLNRIQAIATGTVGNGSVSYDVYEVP